MDPAALAGLCSLLAAGRAQAPLPKGAVCSVAPAVHAAPSRIETSFLADALKAPSARDAIARVAFAEAGNQGDSGLAGVVYAILNRLVDGRWGVTIDTVLNARSQFEPVMRAGGDWRSLPPVSAAAQARVDTILNLALDGRLPDLTHGARYFQNPEIVAQRARQGRVSSRLVNFGRATPSAVIGGHSFYVGEGRGGGVSAPSVAPSSRQTPGSLFVQPGVSDAPKVGVSVTEAASTEAANRTAGDPSKALFVGADGVVRADPR